MKILEDLITNIVEAYASTPNIGLRGKLGFSMLLLKISQYCGEREKTLLSIAQCQLNDSLYALQESLSDKNSSSSIIEIGLGLAYLNEQGFLEASTSIDFRFFDQFVQKRVNNREVTESSYYEIIYLILYLYYRIKIEESPSLENYINRETLIYAIDWLDCDILHLEKFANEAWGTLIQISQLSIYQYKIDKIASKLSPTVNWNSSIPVGIELFQIPKLYLILAWIKLQN